MQGPGRLVKQARHELEEAFDSTRSVWRDATADHYAGRFHRAAIEVLRAYVRALERLEEAIDRAEAASLRG